MANAELVGNAVLVAQAPVYEGVEVKYQHYGSVKVARCNADGTCELDIPGVGLRTVRHEDFEYMVVCLELKIDNVQYVSLAKDASMSSRFEFAISAAIASEAGSIPPAVVSVVLWRTSARYKSRWHGAVLARARVTPPRGTTAGSIHIALTSSPALAQRVTDSILATVPELKTDQSRAARPVDVVVNTITVAPHRTPSPAPELYEQQPEFWCWYYNEDDPRCAVWGRDELQCSQPSPTPNTATTKGRCLWPFIIPCALAVLPCRALL